MFRPTKRFALMATPLIILLTAIVSNARPAAEPPQVHEIKVTARRFEFSPRTITVRKGERVRLVVTAVDVDHGVQISEFNIDVPIKAKQTRVIEFTPQREGRFEMVCSVFCGDGHPDMVGEIVVTSARGASDSNIQVTFDDNSPGVVIVESNGERLRIDTSTKTVSRLSEPPRPPAETKEQPVIATKERESSKAYEPYDYHVINIPTPKRVRRHSLNLHFTHRFGEQITAFDNEGRSDHLKRIFNDFFGLDSFSVSSLGLTYGITDRLYFNIYRSPLCTTGLCKTIEVGLGYHILDEAGRSPIALSAYASAEGDNNFKRNFTYNIQAMIGRSVTKYANVFFSPAVHINSNGQGRFNPRSTDFFPPEPLADQLRLGQHTGSFGFGVNGRIRPTLSLLFEYTPRVGFKMGQVVAEFDPRTGRITGFKNESEAAIGFGIEKRIGRHSFSLTFTNTQTTTTARYNSSNLGLPADKFVIGFNLFRRLL